MKKLILLMIALSVVVLSCTTKESKKAEMEKKSPISENIVNQVSDSLKKVHPGMDALRIEKGVRQTATLWRDSDGDEKIFRTFVAEAFIDNAEERSMALQKLQRNYEILNGYFHRIAVDLQEPLHLDMGELHELDYHFGSYDASSHLQEDMYSNKLAFFVVLNFPAYSLEEKMELGDEWSREDWAAARAGDKFDSRIPAELLQAIAKSTTESDTYISEYNIFMGYLLNQKGEKLFPEDLKLISHWGLRDELKSHYGEKTREAQEMIYQVMLRIISQEIPQQVINSGDYEWNPYDNVLYKDGKEVEFEKEPYTRYKHLLSNFKAMKAVDPYTPLYPTYIERAFSQNMEVTQPEVEQLFREFISSETVKDVAALISERLGRDLAPYDIWYDGFKARTGVSQDDLDVITEERFPNPDAFNEALPGFLKQLGWEDAKAESIASKIVVEPARGAGHAWGAEMRNDVSHLRTRIPESGMKYKGYNIAVHEFGHNVEQTISLHDVDHYFMRGVPNTAFTEAVAFMFQARDLDLLGMSSDNPKAEALATLDNFWSAYEIMGVSIVDMEVWKWLYENPEATPEELAIAVQDIAMEVWNQYYADVFGVADSPILSIYSHMIDAPLYLANYPLGHLIEFQMEEYMKDKEFSEVLSSALTRGRLIPQMWMKKAVGEELSGEPLLKATDQALEEL
ncbi:MAG: hypothetical protein ACLFM1_05830 [Bacteroidales bacterium]